MNRIKDYIEFLGAIGIIVGIVLVILQLQQNEQLLRFQIATELRVNRDNDRLSIRGSDYSATLAKAQSGLELTPSELVEFNAHANSIMSELDLRRMLAGAGIFTADWKNWLTEETCELFSNKVGRSWIQMKLSYSVMGPGVVENDILEEISKRVKKCPPSFSTLKSDEQN